MNLSSPQLEEAAARINLLALWAASGVDRTDDVVLFDGRSRISGEDVVVAHLAGMPKPVQCTAAVMDGQLSLRCGPVEAANKGVFEFRIEASRRVGGLIGMAGQQALREPVDPAVLVVSGHRSLLVEPEALAAWYRNYLVDMSYGIDGRPPVETERVRGAHWIVEFGQLEEFDMHDPSGVPEPARSALRQTIGFLKRDMDFE